MLWPCCESQTLAGDSKTAKKEAYSWKVDIGDMRDIASTNLLLPRISGEVNAVPRKQVTFTTSMLPACIMFDEP